MELHKWADIKNDFRENLLVGNGASIAIDNRLSYLSLYERVRKIGKLGSDLLLLFKEFDTSNFEFIMKLLLEASRVNTTLGIEDNKTQAYYYELRDALIGTVREIHPVYADVKDRLPKIADYLAHFKTVLSLNYDMLIYWAMLMGNEKHGCVWFKDGFNHGVFDKDFRFLYTPLHQLREQH